MHGQSATDFADFADNDDHDHSTEGAVHDCTPDEHGDVVGEPCIPDGHSGNGTDKSDGRRRADATTGGVPGGDSHDDKGQADTSTGVESTDRSNGRTDDLADEADRAAGAMGGDGSDGVDDERDDRAQVVRNDDLEGVDDLSIGDVPGGEAAEPVGRPMRRRRKSVGVNPWVRMSVRVDYAALVRGWVEGDEVCDIPGVGSISVRVARELLGDAVVHLLVTNGKDAAVAYLGRGQNVAQKIASAWTQSECQRLGCHRSVMEWDHRQPYAENRVTEIGNMQGLCRLCHRLKTRFGWELVEGVGKREMVAPSDPRHPANTWMRDGPADLAPEPAEPPTPAAPDSDELMLFDEAQVGDADGASRLLLSPVSA